MKRLIWLPVAGFLLVAGATVAAAAPSDRSGSTGVRGPEVGDESLLSDVLAELVTAGTITQAQSDAIVEALTTNADERRAEFEAQRAEMEAMFTQIKGFLEDGVFSADEIAQLPADNPFTNLSDILADGQITQDELDAIGPFGGPFFGGHGRGHHGPGDHGQWFGPDTDNETNDDTTDATPSPAASPSANS